MFFYSILCKQCLISILSLLENSKDILQLCKFGGLGMDYGDVPAGLSRVLWLIFRIFFHYILFLSGTQFLLFLKLRLFDLYVILHYQSCLVIGRVSGVHCLVVANDATVKGGTIYPISMRAQLRLQALALQLRLPVVYVADSGGAYLQLQAQLFTYGGQCFFNEAILNAAGIPQAWLVAQSYR